MLSGITDTIVSHKKKTTERDQGIDLLIWIQRLVTRTHLRMDDDKTWGGWRWYTRRHKRVIFSWIRHGRRVGTNYVYGLHIAHWDAWHERVFPRVLIHDTYLKIKSCTGMIVFFWWNMYTQNDTDMFIEHIFIHAITTFRITDIMNRTTELHWFISFMNFLWFCMDFDCHICFSWFKHWKIIEFMHLRYIYVDSEIFVDYNYIYKIFRGCIILKKKRRNTDNTCPASGDREHRRTPC